MAESMQLITYIFSLDLIYAIHMERWSDGVLDSKIGKSYFFIPLNASLQYSIAPILQLGRRP